MNFQVVLLNLVIIAACLYILFKSADLLIFGISNYAKKLGISRYIIGLVVIAFAASAPEMISSLFGVLTNHNDIFFGAILGANMVHLALIVGILLVVARNRKFESPILGKNIYLIWVFLMLPLVLLLDGVISRADGALLIAAFIAYIYILWRQEGHLGKLKKRVSLKTIWRDAFIFLGALVALLLGGRFLVYGAVNISNLIGIPTFLIALTVIGIGTTIPDLVVELKALKQGTSALAVGDALGSALIEFLLFFGILALIRPISFEVGSLVSTVIFLMLSLTVFIYVLGQGKGNWKHGLLLVGLFIVFLAIEIFKATA